MKRFKALLIVCALFSAQTVLSSDEGALKRTIDKETNYCRETALWIGWFALIPADLARRATGDDNNFLSRHWCTATEWGIAIPYAIASNLLESYRKKENRKEKKD